MRSARLPKSDLLDISVESGKALPFDTEQREALEDVLMLDKLGSVEND